MISIKLQILSDILDNFNDSLSLKMVRPMKCRPGIG